PSEINNTVAHSGGPTSTISWTDPPGQYNVYRGSKAAGATPWVFNQTCFASHTSASSSIDSDPLATGAADFYLVTRVAGCGESSPGNKSNGQPRPNPNPCP